MYLKSLSDFQVFRTINAAPVTGIPGDAQLSLRVEISGPMKWLLPILWALRLVSYHAEASATWTRGS